MKNLTPELIEKAKSAKTAEELLVLAKENDVETTQEEVNAFYAQLNPAAGELSDDELDSVSGGGCGGDSSTESAEPADFGFPNGQRVFFRNGQCSKCSAHGFYNASKNFVLEWKDYPGGSYRLRCEICYEYIEQDHFVGNPSPRFKAV